MSIVSVFGASPPPGTFSVFTNNPPSITPGGRFYRYGGLLPTATIVGGRVWLPAAAPGSTGIKIMLWLTGNMASTPDREVVVPISGTGWHDGIFASSVAMPSDGVNVRIGYQFVGNPATYIYANDFRADAVDQFVSPQGNGLAYSELQSIFRDGTGPEASPGSFAIYYGVDLLVDDGSTPPDPNDAPTANAGPNQSVLTDTLVTLNGSGSDSDGTIVTYAWTQIGGTAVTLAGSGATRTFTPTTAGTRTFRLTVIDDDGATGFDDVTVNVAAPPPLPSSTAATSSGALKAIIEAAGLSVSAYRDRIPKKASMPCVTIDENVATSQERHGDSGDPDAHAGESELVNVHLWELWRDDNGKPAERYELVRGLKRALRTARPFLYGPDDAPVHVYGLRIDGHARIVEDEENVVHHTVSVTLRRDA